MPFETEPERYRRSADRTSRSAGTSRLIPLIAVLLSLACAAVWATRQSLPITVFAAASLSEAMQTVVDTFRSENPGVQKPSIRLAFAASSTLARQIEAGAAADIFCSADTSWMDYLHKKQLIRPDTRVDLLGNELVLIAPREAKHGTKPEVSAKVPVLTADNVDALLARLGSHGRLAVGDPEHVPAGRYARMALERLGRWQRVSSHLARADNVRAALALVARGESPLGMVYQTDARLSDKIQVLATVQWALLPGNAGDSPEGQTVSHGENLEVSAITYPCAILSAAEDTQHNASVNAFYSYLTGARAALAFTRLGFQIR